MNKISFLIISIIISSINIASGQKKDTLVNYYRYKNGYQQRIISPDSCDFFRVITSPDQGSKLYNITDYFRDGKVKLVGKSKRDMIESGLGTVLFQGSCVSFYNNGKRQSIANYVDGFKVGLDYEYYPDGKLYSICKYIHNPPEPVKVFYVECYKKDGSIICKDGNGFWVSYNNDYDVVVMEGQVINSLKEGDWHGAIALYSDTVKYVYTYHNNLLKSSVGYDQQGNKYPFSTYFSYPFSANNGPYQWIKKFNKNFTRPKDAKGKKMNVDSVRLSFVLEKDGTLSEFKPIGEMDPILFEALNGAFQKCSSGWDPKRFFGIPFRSKITIGIKTTDIYFANYYGIKFKYDEYTLGNNNYP